MAGAGAIASESACTGFPLHVAEAGELGRNDLHLAVQCVNATDEPRSIRSATNMEVKQFWGVVPRTTHERDPCNETCFVR